MRKITYPILTSREDALSPTVYFAEVRKAFVFSSTSSKVYAANARKNIKFKMPYQFSIYQHYMPCDCSEFDSITDSYSKKHKILAFTIELLLLNFLFRLGSKNLSQFQKMKQTKQSNSNQRPPNPFPSPRSMQPNTPTKFPAGCFQFHQITKQPSVTITPTMTQKMNKIKNSPKTNRSSRNRRRR